MVAFQHPKPQRFFNPSDLWFVQGFMIFVALTCTLTIGTIGTTLGVAMAAAGLVLSLAGTGVYASRLWQHYSAEAPEIMTRPRTQLFAEERS
jgi:hypothetical protein